VTELKPCTHCNGSGTEPDPIEREWENIQLIFDNGKVPSDISIPLYVCVSNLRDHARRARDQLAALATQ
jgi:hypothetical protein